jgi:hypothetical protein
MNYPFLTQKERDNETSLDYFGARYYGSSQGRFLSPDPLNPLLSRSSDTQAETWFMRYIAGISIPTYTTILSDESIPTDVFRKI